MGLLSIVSVSVNLLAWKNFIALLSRKLFHNTITIADQYMDLYVHFDVTKKCPVYT